MPNARKTAVTALLKVENDDAYSNIALNAVLNESGLEGADRAFASALFYGVLDRRITLDYVLSLFIKTPLKKVAPFTLTVLRLAVVLSLRNARNGGSGCRERGRHGDGVDFGAGSGKIIL